MLADFIRGFLSVGGELEIKSFATYDDLESLGQRRGVGLCLVARRGAIEEIYWCDTQSLLELHVIAVITKVNERVRYES